MKNLAQMIKNELGGTLYYVRDLFMGTDPKDMDCELFGVDPEEFVVFLNNHSIGFKMDPEAKFPVYRFDWNENEVEVGFPRKDNKTGSKHTDFEIEINPFMGVKTAARRRDFTMNAIYLNVLTDELVDPFHGIQDIENSVLRPVDQETFVEDPLRIFRAFQFIARFGFDYAPVLKNISKTMMDESFQLSKDSIYKEMEKGIIKEKHIKKALDFLEDSEVLYNHFPHLFDLIGAKQSTIHHQEGDVWEHTKRVVEVTMNLSYYLPEEHRIKLFFAALYHDVGKPGTTEWNEKKQDWTQYGHADVGSEIWDSVGQAIIPYKHFWGVSSLIENHMLPFDISDKKIVQLAEHLRGCTMRELLILRTADGLGRKSGCDTSSDLLKQNYSLTERVIKLGVFDGKLPTLVRGEDIVSVGVPQGKQVGLLLSEVRTLQLALQIKTREDALNHLNVRVQNLLNPKGAG